MLLCCAVVGVADVAYAVDVAGAAVVVAVVVDIVVLLSWMWLALLL